MGRLCALRLVALLEQLSQLLLAPARILYLILDGGVSATIAIRCGQSVPGPLPANVPESLVGDMRLRVCSVVEKGVATDDNILQNHRGLVLRSSILGESLLDLELGIEVTPLTLEAQPLWDSISNLFTHGPAQTEAADMIIGFLIWDAFWQAPLGGRPGRMPIPVEVTYQVVTGAPASGTVGPRPPPLLLDLIPASACTLCMACGTKLATVWGAGRTPDVATLGAAKCMLNAEGCWRGRFGKDVLVLKPMPMFIKGVGMEL